MAELRAAEHGWDRMSEGPNIIDIIVAELKRGESRRSNPMPGGYSLLGWSARRGRNRIRGGKSKERIETLY